MKRALLIAGAIIWVLGLVLMFLTVPNGAAFADALRDVPIPARLLGCLSIMAIGYAVIEALPYEGDRSQLDFGTIPVYGSKRWMFRRENYWPFIIGSLILGGLLVIPFLWPAATKLAFPSQPAMSGTVLYSASLGTCIVFVCSFTRNLDFSFIRFALALGVMVFLVFRQAQAGGPGQVYYLPGGIIGFAAMAASGICGIMVARLIGLGNAFCPVPRLDSATAS